MAKSNKKSPALMLLGAILFILLFLALEAISYGRSPTTIFILLSAFVLVIAAYYVHTHKEKLEIFAPKDKHVRLIDLVKASFAPSVLVKVAEGSEYLSLGYIFLMLGVYVPLLILLRNPPPGGLVEYWLVPSLYLTVVFLFTGIIIPLSITVLINKARNEFSKALAIIGYSMIPLILMSFLFLIEGIGFWLLVFLILLFYYRTASVLNKIGKFSFHNITTFTIISMGIGGYTMYTFILYGAA